MIGVVRVSPDEAGYAGLIMAGLLLLAGLFVFSTPAQADISCRISGSCGDQLEALLAAESEIREKPAPKTSKAGVSISVDGEVITGSIQATDKKIVTDNKLEKVDIRITFDGLQIVRRLNVSTIDARRTYKPGETIGFAGSWNYPAWVTRAEIRIHRRADKSSANLIARPLKVIALETDGSGQARGYWSDTEKMISGELVYVLRVYDSLGRFDETLPLSLRISNGAIALDERLDSVPPAHTDGEDRTGISNIPLHGGSVTVHGRHVPPGYAVHVLGEPIEVAAGNEFVVNRILPPGQHGVDVSVKGATKDSGLEFQRDIHIADEEWFYVGIADLTLGRRFGSDAASLAHAYPGEFAETWQKGRLAFYLKGKIRGDTLLTAAFDTTEENLGDLFRNLNEKDPRQLLRNLDPDDYYPVYGDDSTTREDAPTAGRFYVRLERGKSHVLWGNYKTRINGTELARYERSLYGAHAVLKSGQTTTLGEPVVEAEVFAAEPGSLPQRDELRGMGGSAYFLRRQDINQGSEQIVIEVRDRITGLAINRTLLRPDEDYEIDYVQGVILLRRPLQSTTSASGAVKQTAIGGDEQYLIATYEYTPTLTDLDGYTYGGRVTSWLGDHVRVGTTAYVEDTGFADLTLLGADVVIRISEKSYFEIEWAESEGDTFGFVRSVDGGLVFDPQTGTGSTGNRAQAWRAKLAVDLGEITGGKVSGTAGAHYEMRDAGFTAPGRYTSVAERISGAYAEIDVSTEVTIRASYEEVSRENGDNLREASGEATLIIDPVHTATLGVTHSDHDNPIGSTTGSGPRTDIGLRLERTLENGDRSWLFGQFTAARGGNRSRNDRIGAGFETALTDRLTFSLEASHGTLGVGGLASLEYAPNTEDRYYLGYRLDPDTTAGDLNGYDPFGRDQGAIVFGANRRIDERTTAFFEENYDFIGSQRSLTHAYGITYNPEPALTLTGGFEAGEVYDRTNGDFDRVAVSGSASLREEHRSAALRLEARFENGSTSSQRDRSTYLLGASYGYRHDDDWQFVAKLDAVISQSDQTTFLDGDYIEGSVGWAYRPAEDDRLNALFRYTYLEDLPGAQQVNVKNELLGPRQRSHVLEGDFTYDLTEKLSLGGKYGFRIGEIAIDRASDDFTRSSAHLGVVRADYHVIDKWDLLLEARMLWLSEDRQVNTGLLAAAYYHIGENARIGAGYNFGRFSDDVTDLTQDDQGVFVNLTGKF